MVLCQNSLPQRATAAQTIGVPFLQTAYDYLRIISHSQFRTLFSEIAEKGFPLPVVDGIQLINAEVMPGQVSTFPV